MSLATPTAKQYQSASKRLLDAQLAHLFEELFPHFFGPEIRQRLAQRILALVETHYQPSAHLQPGQCLWTVVARETRADSAHVRYVPVVLTLVHAEDISRLAAGVARTRVAEEATARVLQEAAQQGGLLSMRDLSLLIWRDHRMCTRYRQGWEARHQTVLPHPGSLQDMGSCISHKAQIVVQAFYEGQDTSQVARATQHSQRAVDRYLRDFHRVRTCCQHTADLTFICQATGMSKSLVKQYLSLIEHYEPTLLTGNVA